MATDAEVEGEGAEEGAGEASDESKPVEENAPPTEGNAAGADPGSTAGEGEGEDEEDSPFFVEVWNDYDPSMRFIAIFPVGEQQGAAASSVAYYIIEPGKHTGLHSDNVEEVVFVAEGQGEAFMMGGTRRLEAGKFVVFAPGTDHDIYAQGSDALRLLSFFPVTEIESTFQQTIYPMGGTVLSSKPPTGQAPVLTELDPNNLPEDFPFSLAELGMAEEEGPRELTQTERLLGMTEPGKPPEKLDIRVIDPKNPDVNLAAGQGEAEGASEDETAAETAADDPGSDDPGAG